MNIRDDGEILTFKKGIDLGRGPNLTGGGLIQSAGSWSALKALRSEAFCIMGDERILGSSDFVEAVLNRWKRNRNPGDPENRC